MLPVCSSRDEVLAMLAEYIYHTWEFSIRARRFFFLNLVTFFTFSPFLLMTSLSCAIVILL